MTLDFSLCQTPLAHALELHAKGFKVFPCAPNSKIPALKDWQQFALNAKADDLKQYTRHNFGVLCTGITVIDLDTKPDKNGIESIKLLPALPKTLSIKTPSGGYHLYYDGDSKTSVSSLGIGIDTRSEGKGYVVAPGSTINGTAYSVVGANPMQPLPSWVIEKLNETKKEKLTLDAEGGAVESGQRNNTLASMAGTMRYKGMAFDEMLPSLMALNELRFMPPLSVEEVETVANSVCRYKPQDVLGATAFMEVNEKLKTLDDCLLFGSKVRRDKIKKRQWFMDGRYAPGFISVIVSPGGLGKSQLTMLDAVSMAKAISYTGFAVPDKKRVLIYNTEDPADELARRLQAIKDHYELADDDADIDQNIVMLSGRDAPTILASQGRNGTEINTEAIDTLVGVINKHRINVVLIDPFVQAHQVSENDNSAMSVVIRALNQIIERTGCAMGIVHHSKKGGAMGNHAGDADQARGASALISAARIAHTLSPITEKECEILCIDKAMRGYYVRFDVAKSNMMPPSSGWIIFERQSVTVNGEKIGTLKLTDLGSKNTQEAMRVMRDDTDRTQMLDLIMNNYQEAKEAVELEEEVTINIPIKKLHDELLDSEASGFVPTAYNYFSNKAAELFREEFSTEKVSLHYVEVSFENKNERGVKGSKGPRNRKWLVFKTIKNYEFLE
jgi:RecA-family ATPase